eukprot:gene1458-12077_t
MEVSKHLVSLLKEKEKNQEEIIKLFNEMLEVLKKDGTSAVLPVDTYTQLYTKVFELTSKIAILEEVSEKISDIIATYLNDSITKAFEKVEEKNETEVIDLILDSWEIATKLKEWIEKIFKNVSDEKNPTNHIILFYKLVIGGISDEIFKHIPKYVNKEISAHKILKEQKKTNDQKKDEDEPKPSSFLDEIANFKKNKLKKVQFDFPEKVDKIIKLLVEFGLNAEDLENEEFMISTKDYFRHLIDEKERDSKFQGISSGNHTSSPVSRRRFPSSYFEDDDTEHRDNEYFYKNEIKSSPNGDYIDKIHKKWFGDWVKLERKHDYIQWLFPIREAGLNGQAQPMTKNESLEFQKNQEMQRRMIKSYEMMLDFYGMILLDEKTGEVDRNHQIWEGRIHHLNHSFHNYLRITRILKCLGMCGLEHLKLGWLKFLIQEVFYYQTLDSASGSLLEYWLPTLRKRSELIEAETLIFEITSTKVDRKKFDNEPESWACVKIIDVEEEEPKEEDIKSEEVIVEKPKKYVLRRFLSDEEEAELKKQEEALQKLKLKREEERKKKYLDEEAALD